MATETSATAPTPILYRYNEQRVPEIFGLDNRANDCHINSLVQALLSLPALIDYLINNKEKLHPVARELLKLHTDNINIRAASGPSGSIDADSERLPNSSTAALFDAIVEARKGRKSNLTVGRQEDAHEDLMFLLECMGPGVEDKFKVRYACRIQCAKCGLNRPVEHQEPPEVTIDLGQGGEAPVICDDATFIRHMSVKEQYPSDYKCEGKDCGAVNGKDQHPVKQVYKLSLLSEIIVVVYKKYQQKASCHFPKQLQFNSKSGPLIYRVVAQVDHYGGMYGGHYKMRGLRNKTVGFNEKRTASYQRQLNGAAPARRELIRQADTVHKANYDSRQAVFEFNDTKITYSPSGFIPNANTYLVFYHLT